MTPKGPTMSMQAVVPVAKGFGIGTLNAVAVFAAISDATWLAAGTFVTTLGIQVMKLYQMRIDANRDKSVVDLSDAKKRITALETQAKDSEKQRGNLERQALLADQKARDADRVAAEAQIKAAKLEGLVAGLQHRTDQLGSNQHEIRNIVAATKFTQDAMQIEMARKPAATPDPDVVPKEVVVVNPPDHPVNVSSSSLGPNP